MSEIAWDNSPNYCTISNKISKSCRINPHYVSHLLLLERAFTMNHWGGDSSKLNIKTRNWY